MATALEQFGVVLGRRSIEQRDKPFTLKSGVESHYYADLRQGHSWGPMLLRSGRYLLELTRDVAYNTIAGEGVDGRAVVSGMLMASHGLPYRHRQNLEARWANSAASEPPIAEEPKNGRGFYEPHMTGRLVLAVDGTLTSGGSLAGLVSMIREANGVVEHAAVVVDRSSGRSAEAAAEMDVQLYSLFQFDETNGMLVPTQTAVG